MQDLGKGAWPPYPVLNVMLSVISFVLTTFKIISVTDANGGKQLSMKLNLGDDRPW